MCAKRANRTWASWWAMCNSVRSSVSSCRTYTWLKKSAFVPHCSTVVSTIFITNYLAGVTNQNKYGMPIATGSFTFANFLLNIHIVGLSSEYIQYTWLSIHNCSLNPRNRAPLLSTLQYCWLNNTASMESTSLGSLLGSNRRRSAVLLVINTCFHSIKIPSLQYKYVVLECQFLFNQEFYSFYNLTSSNHQEFNVGNGGVSYLIFRWLILI